MEALVTIRGNAGNDARLRTLEDGTSVTTFSLAHTPPASFHRGQDLTLSLETGAAQAARLRIRHVNQAEAWQEFPAVLKDGQFVTTVPATYTNSPFPLQYFFAVEQNGSAGMVPGLAADLCNQPYFILRQG